MPRSRRTLVRWLLFGLVVVLVAVGVGVLVNRLNRPAAVRSASQLVPVVDGPARDQHVLIDSTVYFPSRTPAPAVLIAPGFGETKSAVDGQAQDLARQGFVVLAYTPRGFGHSTGLIALNSPDYEVADARQLVDWLAARPEVRKDGPNDPRIGVTGGSYGGALALLLAGTDPRIDAIAPVITYNDLSQALVPNASTTGVVEGATPAPGAFAADGVFKKSWAGILFGTGLGQRTQTTQTTPGADPPAAATCGRFVPEVCQAYEQIATTGRATQQTIDLLRRDSPVSVTGHIHVPTLLVQGEQDTLFGLDQADANARQIAATGAPVKMTWFNGGHDAGPPNSDVDAQITAWFQYHLAGTGPNPGTGFQYAVQGSIRANGVPSVRTVIAPGYPGLTGDSTTQRQTLALQGPPQQPVLNPPGGSPAAVSGLPGVGGALGGAAAGRLASDIPGENASFVTAPLAGQILVAGAPTVSLRISGSPGQAELFVKLYDIAPNGTRTLPGAAVAPIRVTLPPGGAPADVTVTLAGIVQPVQAGHRLQLVVSTTDSSYANVTTPGVVGVGLASDGLSVPVVPGRTGSVALPVPQLVGIGVVLLLCLLTGGYLLIRRRRPDPVDADFADTPLVLKGLSKAYPGGVVAVDDLSFEVRQGQVVGLLGPNGAGKTTALRMMMGLVHPSAGSIRLFGHLVRPGAPVLSRIGSFVEGPGFLPHLSGMANLKLYWAATGRPTEHARFDEALAIAGLGDAVRRRVGTYSQGMRQRLAIAQAMLGLPDLLILDEPTNGLDPPQIRDMRGVLRDYAAGGRTVLVSSHLLTEVEQTCSHVVVMHLGRLVAAGEVREIVGGSGETSFRVDDADRAAGVLRELVPDVELVDGQVFARLNGVPRSAAVDALVHAGVAVDQVGPRGRLEDAFLHLVGGGAK